MPTAPIILTRTVGTSSAEKAEADASNASMAASRAGLGFGARRGRRFRAELTGRRRWRRVASRLDWSGDMRVLRSWLGGTPDVGRRCGDGEPGARVPDCPLDDERPDTGHRNGPAQVHSEAVAEP